MDPHMNERLKELFATLKGAGSPTARGRSTQAPPTLPTSNADKSNSAEQQGRAPWTEQQIRDQLGLPDHVNVKMIPLGDFLARQKFSLKDALDAIKTDLEGPYGRSMPPVTGDVTERNAEIPLDEDASETIEAFVEDDKVDEGEKAAITEAVQEIVDELVHAQEKHAKPFNSPHEGYAIIKEELDELWDEVKADNGCTHLARKEAIQVAATALRYLLDIDPR